MKDYNLINSEDYGLKRRKKSQGKGDCWKHPIPGVFVSFSEIFFLLVYWVWFVRTKIGKGNVIPAKEGKLKTAGRRRGLKATSEAMALEKG